MSKVLVDRELLESLLDDPRLVVVMKSEQVYGIKEASAQPAEAEGVEVVAWRHFGDRTRLLSALGKDRALHDGAADEFTIPLMTVAQHNTALSAVTAEVEGLRKDAERYRMFRRGMFDPDRFDADIDAMAAKEA